MQLRPDPLPEAALTGLPLPGPAGASLEVTHLGVEYEAFPSPTGDGNILMTHVPLKSGGRFHMAEITPRQVPVFASGVYIPLIWFAYASSDYLSSRSGSNSLERITMLGAGYYPPGIEESQATVSRDGMDPKLPETATWLVNPRVEYSVTAWQSSDGLKIPSKWSFKIYGGNSEVWNVIRVTNARVTLHATLPKDPLAAVVAQDGPIRTIDFRFAVENADPIPRLFYDVTNHWPSKSEIRGWPIYSSYSGNSRQ